MNVIGVDGGNNGAFAVLNHRTGKIERIIDMPVFHMTINGKQRKRIDSVGVLDLLRMEQMLGCELVMIEAVGGRPRQNASAAFVFGYGIGLIYMACIALKLPIETTPPTEWKKLMRMPGKKDTEGAKKKEKDGKIISRADELMPDARDMWRTPKGAYRVDRAEAACIAKYASDFRLRVDTRPPQAIETLLTYQFNADLGA